MSDRRAGRAAGRSSWWVHRSLRARLTAAATLIIAIGMSAAAVLLVVRLQTGLQSNLDTTLTQQVQSVAADARHGRLSRPLTTGAETAALVQVAGADGQVVSSSANIDGESRLFTVAGGHGDPAFSLNAGVPLGQDGTTYRVASLVVLSPTGALTVYVGMPTTGITASVAELTQTLAFGVPFVVLLLAAVGWLLVGRALRPVEAMRLQAAAIPGTDLHRRLAAPPGDDELNRLAITFNDLLSRIETSAGRQRRFVADAAHELRSPLAVLRTELEVSVRHPSDQSYTSAAPQLLADVERLSRLVDDLLQLARLDASAPVKHLSVDLDDLLLDQVQRHRGRGPRIDTTGVTAARVVGDPQALARVVQNLLDNAVRHAGHCVSITLGTTDELVHLVVADDGSGVPTAERGRIFDRFTRLDDARSRDAGGSGLGLAIVTEILAIHGGHVQVQDNEPGARFTVTLPASDQ